MIDPVDLVNRIYEAAVILNDGPMCSLLLRTPADARDAALIAAWGTSFAR